MLLLGIITLVMTIPLASLYLSTILIHRFVLLIMLYSALLSYNTLYVVPLSTGIGLLGGLFQITILSQSLEIFILILGGIILFLVPEGKEISTKLFSFSKENNNLENIKDPIKTATLWNY
jgi:NADH-ubiquinone oxidoreductase chain 2